MKLPDKLSDLILVALADLEACEKDPRYRIDMTIWHKSATKTSPCAVCFAGAVMAKSGGVSSNKTLAPSDCNWANEWPFWQLEYIRQGEIEEALEEPDFEIYDIGEQTMIRKLSAGNDTARAEWKNFMLDIAVYLKSEGF